jgi:ribosomal protein S18
MSELSNIDWIIERTKIIDIVVGFANAMDNKDWQKLRSYLAEEIKIDYSEFRGEQPRRITAQEYIQQRQISLTGLRSLHISKVHLTTELLNY